MGITRVNSELINLEDFLYQIGKDAECHFTLEQVSDRWMPRIEEDAVADLKAEMVKELAAELNERIKDFRFIQNEKNPRVIHVMEKRLTQVQAYALEQKIDLKFSGNLGQLSSSLHEKLSTIGGKGGGDWRESFDDHVTEVRIDAKDQKIRDILTDSSDWREYNPIIWRAETALGTGKTTVQYYWPKDWHRK